MHSNTTSTTRRRSLRRAALLTTAAAAALTVGLSTGNASAMTNAQWRARCLNSGGEWDAYFMNGAMQWLSALTPATVEQTPWFDRIIPFRTDTSTSGTPLRIAQQDYERGLCLHSRTILEYDLAILDQAVTAVAMPDHETRRNERATLRTIGGAEH